MEKEEKEKKWRKAIQDFRHFEGSKEKQRSASKDKAVNSVEQ